MIETERLILRPFVESDAADAFEYLHEPTVNCFACMKIHSLEEAKALQDEHGGYIKTMWCGDLECELAMKEKAGMSSRCIPFAQENLGDKCACCGKEAHKMIYWGVAY